MMNCFNYLPQASDPGRFVLFYFFLANTDLIITFFLLVKLLDKSSPFFQFASDATAFSFSKILTFFERWNLSSK